jgi:hypothetical protein
MFLCRPMFLPSNNHFLNKLWNIIEKISHLCDSSLITLLKIWRKIFSSHIINLVYIGLNRNNYSRITSTKSLLFCKTIFSASLTNLTAPLPQSQDSSCYESSPILAPPLLWLQKRTDIRAHDFTHFPDLWHEPVLLRLPGPEARSFVEVILLYCVNQSTCFQPLDHYLWILIQSSAACLQRADSVQ